MSTRYVNIVRNINELWSIYRSLFICKNEEEVDSIYNMLNTNGFPTTKDMSQPEKCRILVQSWDTFYSQLDDIQINDFTVIYLTMLNNIIFIKEIIKEHNIKCVIIL